MTTYSETIKSVRHLVKDSSRIVFFTGAGISTESGISDFRSKGGIWEKYQPVTFQEFLTDEEKRREYWIRKKELYVQMRNAKPNAGHKAIAHAESAGNVLGVITQNIDGLHHEAGSKNILELHGTNREVICLDCRRIIPFETVYQRLLQGEEIPLCEKCEGLLKPNTISFGQNLDSETLMKSVQWAKQSDLFFAIGSSLLVEPAGSLPRFAVEAGSKLIIINKDSTPKDSLATTVIHAPTGKTLEELYR